MLNSSNSLFVIVLLFQKVQSIVQAIQNKYVQSQHKYLIHIC